MLPTRQERRWIERKAPIVAKLATVVMTPNAQAELQREMTLQRKGASPPDTYEKALIIACMTIVHMSETMTKTPEEGEGTLQAELRRKPLSPTVLETLRYFALR